MPVEHYENFPVASWLLPRRLRKPVEAIYRFARGADDIADEGDWPDAERLAGLDHYVHALDQIEAGHTPDHEAFRDLAIAVGEHRLPVPLLRDLIEAFRQDVTQKRYASYTELREYARRSANPVGRLLLHLFGRTEPSLLQQSDAICSALQFINFWQDVAVDYRKGRIYIPLEDLALFGVREAQIPAALADPNWSRLMAFECLRSRELLLSGAALGGALGGRVGLEIRATVQGGAAILDKIDAVSGDVFRHRPVLRGWDWAKVVLKALLASEKNPGQTR